MKCSPAGVVTSSCSISQIEHETSGASVRAGALPGAPGVLTPGRGGVGVKVLSKGTFWEEVVSKWIRKGSTVELKQELWRTPCPASTWTLFWLRAAQGLLRGKWEGACCPRNTASAGPGNSSSERVTLEWGKWTMSCYTVCLSTQQWWGQRREAVRNCKGWRTGKSWWKSSAGGRIKVQSLLREFEFRCGFSWAVTQGDEVEWDSIDYGYVVI